MKKQLAEMQERLKQLTFVLEPLSTEQDTDIKYRIDVIGDLRQISAEIRKCEENIATLEKNSNMIMKQVQLSTLEKMLEEIAVNLNNQNRAAGKIEERISLTKQRVADEKVNHAEKAVLFEQIGDRAGDSLPIWKQEYEKQTVDKSFTQFKDNYLRRRKANQTLVDRSVDAMKGALNGY